MRMLLLLFDEHAWWCHGWLMMVVMMLSMQVLVLEFAVPGRVYRLFREKWFGTHLCTR